MNRLGIRNRVLVISLLPLVITALVLSSHFIWRRVNEIQQDLITRGQGIASHLAPACEYGLFAGNRHELQSLANGAAQERDVLRVWIVDRDGKTVADAHAPADGTPQASEATDTPTFSAPVFLTPVSVGDLPSEQAARAAGAAPLGRVHVALSAAETAARQAGVLLQGLLITLLAVSATALFAVRMSRTVSVPVLELTNAVRAIKKGALGYRTAAHSGGEIGVLERGINDMASALEEARERERLRAADALYLEQIKAQVTLESIGEGVVTTDAQGRITYLNPQAEQLIGWRRQNAEARALGEVVRIARTEEETARPYPLERCLQAGEIVRHDSGCVMRRRDGSSFAVQDTASPIRNRQGRIIGAVLVFRDFTEIKRMADLLSYQATHDELTGLINRRAFELRLRELLNRAAAHEQHLLCYIDLDQFKVVNDTCGHAAGDELLRQLAFRLSARVRSSDILARLGGDEFGVILRDCDAETGLGIAEALREAAREFRFSWGAYTFEVGVSIGAVAIDREAGNLADVLSAADSACYVAKDHGRNRLHLYQADDLAVAQRHGEMQWVQRIQRSLATDRFCLYAQPIVPIGAETKARHRQHFEVLVRMVDEDGALVPPMAFIPAAERYQLMPALDRWVIAAAFRALQRAGLAALHGGCAFNVNLSGQSLGDEQFLDFVVGEFETHGIEPASITFEITETAAIANLSGAVHFMTTLKGMGCRFALDDFGSGLSSFGYLQNLPVDFIKIDGHFVKDVTTNPLNRAMIVAINNIGHVMGLDTIAEFVESEAILEHMRDCGVDFAQGHALAEPMPLPQALAQYRGEDGRRNVGRDDGVYNTDSA